MNQDYKICVDGGRPATLNDGAGGLIDCATLQEAMLVWHRLESGRKMRIIGGRIYVAHEIERFHCGPKPE